MVPRPVRSWWERDGRSAKIQGRTGVSRTASVVGATDDEVVIPKRVQEALAQLAGAAREELLALSVEVGLGVRLGLLEREVEEAVGPKGSGTPIGPLSVIATRTGR